GTLLDTAAIIRDSQVPVLGINTGRLGFLSNVAIQDIESCVEALLNGNFTLDGRSLIAVGGIGFSEHDFPFALNDVTLRNNDHNSMIAVQTYVNDIFMCTYWADGLIVSTPTGSTAYSLSCGGPIVTPDSNNIILTPIAPHNLSVRPFVLSNSNTVTLQPEARSGEFFLTLDSRTYPIDKHTRVELTRASFELNLVNLEGHNFFNTIRNKLGWAVDKRN
ncbi:MAG: NAD(+)/NADH kinase, partial [Crocinitomicaceae bacterium]|nr:NAD(+)/NADH kinase [Crocinitomicaceae bacterium]